MHIAGLPSHVSQYVVTRFAFFRAVPLRILLPFEYFRSRICIFFCSYELVLHALWVCRSFETKSWCLQVQGLQFANTALTLGGGTTSLFVSSSLSLSDSGYEVP